MTRRQVLAILAGSALCPFGCKQLTGQTQTLRVANWGGAGDDSEFFRLVQKIYREFESQHGVTLRIEGTPGSQDYVSKLLLDYVAGSMPDVVTLDASSAAAFIDNGALMDLMPYIRRDSFDLNAFLPNVVDIARRDERIFAIPTDFTPMVMYCNLKLFREAGVDPPSRKWTFEEFLSASKRLTSPGQHGFEFANWMPAWVMFLWNNGADVLSADGQMASGVLDSPKSVEAVQFLADMVLKHKVSPDLSQSAAVGVDYFATGRAAMKVSGHWNLIALRAGKDIDMKDVFIAEMPTQLNQSVTVMYEAGNAIGSNCRNPDLAWEYLKYFSSSHIQSPYNSSGIAVCARKDVEEAKLKKYQIGEGISDAQRSFLFQESSRTARAPWGTRVEGYDQVEDRGQKALDAILKNGVPVREALQQAAYDIDQELARR